MAKGIGVGFTDNIKGVIGNMKKTLLNQTGNLTATVGVNGNLSEMERRMGNVGGNTSNVVNLTINTQHLSDQELDNVFNYINTRFGMAF